MKEYNYCFNCLWIPQKSQISSDCLLKEESQQYSLLIVSILSKLSIFALPILRFVTLIWVYFNTYPPGEEKHSPIVSTHVGHPIVMLF